MADDGKRIMDQGWVKVQQKTFTKWSNNHIVKKFGKDAVLTDLETDFETGEKLMQLCHSLYGLTMPKYNKTPKMRPHKLDNCTLALNMLEKDAGVKTNFLKTTHLVDKDLKMILGMIWAIILHYQIQGISVEDLSAKEGLLLWCQKKTKGYRDVDPPKIKGFTNDWQNGLAFCALIHKHRPDLIDYDSLNKDNARENLELAFSVAEKELGIPRLLEVEDLVDVPRPDERSVMTYVSEYFHCFASQGESDAAGQRIAGLVANARANDALKKDYNTKAGGLREWTVNKTEAHKDRNFGDSLSSVEGKWSEFANYKKSEKPPKNQEKLGLEADFATLQTKLRVQGRAPYTPPAGLGPKDIDGLWNTLNDTDRERGTAIRDELERQQRIKALVDRFTRRADALDAWASSNNTFLGQSDVGTDLASCQAHLKTLEGFEADYSAASERLASVKSIGNELVGLGYSEADRITGRMGTLDSTWTGLRTGADSRKSTIEAELARQQKLEDLRLEFGKRGRVFINWIDSADVLNEALHFNTLKDVTDYETQFKAFQAEKATKAGEYDALAKLDGDLKNEGITSNFYAVYSMDDITARWNKVNESANAIEPALNGERERLAGDDKLCKEFADKAAAFSTWIDGAKAGLANVSGTPEEQVAAIGVKRGEFNGESGRLDEVQSLDHQLAERGVINNPHTALDANTLKADYQALISLATSEIDTLEKEMAKSNEASGVGAEQMAEFKEMFAHFDKDGNNQLEKHEFKACLSALGYSKSDAEMDQIMPGTAIRFDEFAEYMSKQNDSSDTADNMREAFKIVAGGKNFVTEADLRAVLDNDTVDYLLANMTKGADGYSYEEWTNAQYA